MFYNVLIDKIKKCLTNSNLATIAFFVGRCAKLLFFVGICANLKLCTRKLHFL